MAVDVVTLGESMILFQTLTSGALQYAPLLTKTIAGAESNLAVGLTRLGKKVSLFTRVGADPFGNQLVATLMGEGVQTDYVVRDPENPTGIYFKELKPNGDPHVYYYRRGSAASQMNPEDFPVEMLKDARLLHVTGITPALSQGCRDTVQTAMRSAREQGLTVSFDPNLRRKLWSEDEAKRTLLSMISLCDIFLPGVEEGEFLFGTADVQEIARLSLRHGARIVVVKRGAEGSSVFTSSEEYHVPGFPVAAVIDTVGAGDGFAAGFLSSWLDQLPLAECLRRANAIGAMATQYYGDWEGLPRTAELEAFLSNRSQVTR
ncbi:MAG: phosphomethylpyrimidine kinase family protein [Bacilli bacterium]|nr:phosphomethylpyrimidine kinase family protein [Bacilli bacterium]